MYRTFAFIAVLASIGSIGIPDFAMAQPFVGKGKRRSFNPVKPPKIRIPKPGPYQQKIIRGAYQGAKTGSEIGGNFGGAGTIVGGVQGAVFGGAYADHQHNSNRVHNYRTPYFPLSSWSYGAAQGGGAFHRAGNLWYEVKGGRRYATFRQINQSGNHVLLYDASRNLEVKLDHEQALWRNPGGSWNYLIRRVR